MGGRRIQGPTRWILQRRRSMSVIAQERPTAKRARIAVDAMGGDLAPEETVAGALLAAQEYDAEITLIGDEARIVPLLKTGRKLASEEAIRVVHAPEAVPMDQHPSQ